MNICVLELQNFCIYMTSFDQHCIFKLKNRIQCTSCFTTV